MDAKVHLSLEQLGLDSDSDLDLLSAILAEPGRLLSMIGLDALLRTTAELAARFSLEQVAAVLQGEACFCGQPVVVDCPYPVDEHDGTI